MSWQSVKISELAAVSSGGGAPQDPNAFSSEGIPFIRAGSLVKLLDDQPEQSLELLQPDVASAHKLKVFPKGTVLFAKSGMSATKGHIYQLKNPAYVVNHLAALVPHSEVSGRYLKQVLRFKSPTCLIKDEAYPSIRLGDIEDMEIPAPKCERERERITAILEQADDLRRKRQHVIDRLKQLGQAIFQEMFGDATTNPMGWPVVELGDIVRRGDKINYGVVQPGDEVEAGVPLVRVGDLQSDYIDPNRIKKIDVTIEASYERSRLHGDEILIGCVGSIGTVALAHEGLKGANIARAVARVPVDAVLAERVFIAELIKSPLVQRYFAAETRTVAQPTLNIGLIASTPIILPPMSDQTRFATRINEIIQSTILNLSSAEIIGCLFASLQARAFRGEL